MASPTVSCGGTTSARTTTGSTNIAALAAIQEVFERTTVSDPLLGAMARTSKRVIQMAQQVPDNTQDCEALALRVALITTDILNRISVSEAHPDFLAMVKPVKQVVDDIDAFLVTQVGQNALRRLLQSSERKRKIQQFGETLDQVMIDFHDSLLRDFLIRSQSGRDTREAARSQITQLPSDLPPVRIPSKPQIFYGRDEMVQSAVTSLTGRQTARVAILGPGGMGKTSLATTILHDQGIIRKYGTNRIFIPCDGVTTAGGIISVLALALKVVGQGDTRQAVLNYFRMLRSSAMLVLDNLESAWDKLDMAAVEELLSEFANIPTLSLVVTMRGTVRPAGVDWSHPFLPVLSSLELDDARRIFVSISRRHEGDAELDTLLALLDGLPLAITLMAYQGQVLGPTDLLKAYEREKTGLLDRGRGRRLTSLDVSIEISLRSLTMQEHPHAQKLLSQISVLPDGVNTPDIPNIFPTMSQRGEASRVLVQVGLATNADGVIKVLSPIRDFMLASYPPEGIHLSEMRLYFIQVIRPARELPNRITPEHRKRLTQNFGNIRAVLTHVWTTSPAAATELRLPIATLNLAYFSYMYSYGDCIGLLTAGRSALQGSNEQLSNFAEFCFALSRQAHSQSRDDEAITRLVEARAAFSAVEDRRGEAQCLRDVGNILRLQNRYTEATARLTEAMVLFHQSGDARNTAQCLFGLGNILRMQNRYDEATTQLMKAKAVFDSNGDRLGSAQCAQTSGRILRMQDNLDAATSQFTEARTGFENLGERLGATQCMQSLGDLLSARNQYDDAITMLTAAKAEFDAIADRRGVAQCTQSIGDILRVLDRYNEADSILLEAKIIFQAIGDRNGATQCAQSLGEILRMQDKFDDAELIFIEAKKGFEAIGGRLGAAQCTRSLGDVLRMQSRYDEAVARLTEAKTGFEGVGDRVGAAQSSQSIGTILRMQGQFADAMIMVTGAKATFEVFNDRRGTAQCIQSLGNILRMQEKYDEAVMKLEEATAIFDSIPDRLGAAQCTQSIGEVLQIQQRLDEALTRLTQAKTNFDAIEDRRGAANCNLTLGLIFRTQNNPAQAILCLREGRGLFEQIQFKLGVALCSKVLGGVWMQQGRHEESMASFREALSIFEEIGSVSDAGECRRALTAVEAYAETLRPRPDIQA